MKRFLLVVAALAVIAGVAWKAGFGPITRAEAATLQVDFEHGHDDANGLTPATAWKHAPGDPMAKGLPARTVLRAGDVVTFAAGVRYRGTIYVTASGTPEAPIMFTGATPDGSAIIDGSDPAVSVAPCRSAEECGGAPGWNRLTRIEAAEPITEGAALFTEKGPLNPAQTPDPKDPFYRNEIEDMWDADGATLTTGRAPLPHAVAQGLASGGGRLALWVKPNVIAYRPILSLEGDVALFDATGLQFYMERPEKVAVINHVSLLGQPNEYALLPDGKSAVAMLPAGAGNVSIARGRGGFVIKGASHLAFRNLTFEKISDGGGAPPNGVAIYSDRVGSTGLKIENNHFRWFDMPKGQGPIILRGFSDVRITGNVLESISLGSGMRLAGPAEHLVIEDNKIRRFGRTGIMLMGVSDASVQRNVITDALGVHGNGMSAYLNNHDIRFIANTVTNAKQPVTFEGSKKATQDTDLLFANNLFIATPDALGSLISWGANTRSVTIRNNILLGGKTGMRLNASDTGVIASDNIASGLIIVGERPADWQLAGNEWTDTTFQQRKDGSQISKAFVGVDTLLLRGQLPPKICAVITRHSIALTPASGEASPAVGAELKCP
jgi:hypothetical protein